MGCDRIDIQIAFARAVARYEWQDVNSILCASVGMGGPDRRPDFIRKFYRGVD